MKTPQHEPGGQREQQFPGDRNLDRPDPDEVIAAFDAFRASGEGRALDTERQQQVARVLDRLLGHGLRRRLPAVSWTVTCSGPQLLARCDDHPRERRPADFAEWKAALAALAGPPDHADERAFAGSGQTRAYAVWENLGGVRVSLTAEWDTPAPDSHPAAGDPA